MSSSDTETRLRGALDDASRRWEQDWPDVTVDPWQRVAAGVRTRRRHRVATAGAVIVTGAVVGLVAVQGGGPREESAPASTSSPVAWDHGEDVARGLALGGPRGALAQDEDFVADVDASLRRSEVFPEEELVEDDPLRMIYADDVGTSRVVVLDARVEQPFGSVIVVRVELTGAAGTAGDDLEVRNIGYLDVGRAWPLVALPYEADDGQRRALVLLPRGASASLSDGPRVDPVDGTFAHVWRDVDVPDDGVLDVDLEQDVTVRLDAAPGYPVDQPVAVEWLPGRPQPGDGDDVDLVGARGDLAASGRAAGDPLDDSLEESVARAERDLLTVRALAGFGQGLAGVTPTVLWMGGDPDGGDGTGIVVTTGRPGEGRLVAWVSRADDGSEVAWTCAYPALDPADELLAWRVLGRVPGRPDVVGWLAPVGTSDVEVVSDGEVLATMTSDGHGRVEVSADAQVTVTALDADGAELQVVTPRPSDDEGWLTFDDERPYFMR